MVLARLVPAFSNRQNIVLAGGLAIGHRRQRLDVDRDRLQRVLGERRAVGHHDRDRLADVAHLADGDDRLLVALELGQRLLPQRNVRHVADIGRRDHGVHARPRARRRRVDRADAAVRDRAAQDHRMQHFLADEIVDVLSAPGEKAEVLDALDRAADEGVPARVAWGSGHMTIVASRLMRARATLSAASADVFGFVRDGLP